MRTYLYWKRVQSQFSRVRGTKAIYPYSIFTHRTPLYRKLANVDKVYQDNKVTNLKIAAPKINGVVIRPGETFSYWYLIGSCTKRKGYVPGMELFSGSFRFRIGGGLCQLSNLLYWIFIHSELTITRRYRHSYDVFPDAARTQPFGSGATCYYPFMDLEVVNNTNRTYQIVVTLDNEHLVGELRADAPEDFLYDIEERNHRFISQPWGKYTRHNELYKIMIDKKNHARVGEKFLVKNDAICMYDPFLPTRPN